MPHPVLTSITLPGLTKLASGKVREIFDLGDALLFVASDRISAFDVIMPDGIPDKGRVLTQMSRFWFERFGALCKNHLISASLDEMPGELHPHRALLDGRALLVKKARIFPIECVARGYLIGSGWKDYQKNGEVCGVKLPKGLRQAEKLPATIFTPATKAESGHDENISFAQAAEIVGREVMGQLRDLTIRLYETGAEYARERGIIIADTKFEFGLIDGEIALCDEVLTPDSSRFWPADRYQVGISPQSFDKQFLRDYLETLTWNKTAPGPQLPKEVLEGTRARYLEIFERLTGAPLSQ